MKTGDAKGAFKAIYREVVDIAETAAGKADTAAVGKEIDRIEQGKKPADTAPLALRIQALVEKLAGVNAALKTEHTISQLYQRAIGGALSIARPATGKAAKVDPEWKDPKPGEITEKWEQFGGAREGWGAGGRMTRTGYFTTEKKGDVILPTEPYELAKASWPENEGRAQNGYYVRNKHTGEVLARIEQGFGWSWNTYYKHLDEDGKQRGGQCHLLRGAFLDFFHNVKDTEFVQLDGTTPPIIRGTLYTEKDENARKVMEKFEQNGLNDVWVTWPTPYYRDFQRYTGYPTFEVKYHEGYGIEIYNHDQNYHQYPEILAALAGDDLKNLKLVDGDAGPGQHFGGSEFSWEKAAKG